MKASLSAPGDRPAIPAVASLLLLALLASTGCPSNQSQLPLPRIPALVLERVEPQIVLPGTWIQIFGQGFVDTDLGSIRVSLESSGQTLALKAERVGETLLRFQIDPSLFATLAESGAFVGSLAVTIEYKSRLSVTQRLSVQWTLRETLTPRLARFVPTDGIVFLGKEVQLEGSDFLLEGEGKTEVRLEGAFTPADGSPATQQGFTLPLTPVGRERLSGLFAAECFGISPGRFQGSLQVINLHQDGTALPSASLKAVAIELGPTLIHRLEPGEIAPRQWLQVSGKGFTSGTATTSLRLEGTLTDRQGRKTELRGLTALEVIPEVLSGESMRYALKVQHDSLGDSRILGAVPGVFTGTITPVVYYLGFVQRGVALAGSVTLTLLPLRQVAFLKYLPGFTEALRAFGLRNQDARIRARILEVVRRDYQDFSVEFRTVRPTDFFEYAVVEVGGQDPNNRDLLGLDNTMGKDTGNVYFDDVVGGWNAESAEIGNAAYGGVFISSFLGFSPKWKKPMPIASPAFDQVYGPFAPHLGGREADEGELPDGPRAAAIELAIRVAGNLIGSTISHEFGHTLGLAEGPPHIYHNLFSGENQLMDAGSERPFAERAELDGQGPGTWTQGNRDYLEEVLPD